MPRLNGFRAVHDPRVGLKSGLLEPPDQFADVPMHLLPLILGVRGSAIEVPMPGELPEVGVEAGPECHQVGARQLHAVRPAHPHAGKLPTTSTGGPR